ncbi:hypothetical protein GYMLUDRAFT_244664 [Collybiopsis luxurians FD-317 M1]|uniref:Unplaced genomic scaffold GYMLUscaffold_28, whole genome shotgun sequence n=1 Tax=Collybiopsis luxurians FD-317 M1 TaxID=944289 RepID=A0A0D0BX37_9AGAR|nr:hypothetical protein GYMLUDRAFT_244664 [Collybiopsis luxurians FD-317 M1]
MQAPLPKRQIFLTLLIQLSEPTTAMVIYPFIIKAVHRTGITQGDEKRTGYYAGIIESLFFISESLSAYHIGRASDFYGRKPLLLIGPLGLSIAMVIFGLSKSLWGMAIARTLMGVFNGNIGVSKTVMAESTDETNRADAFMLMPLVWTIGTVIGSVLGGVLADPARTWPHVFGKIWFFEQYPWFLPCFAAGLLAFYAFALSSWGFKKTLPKKAMASPSLLNDAEAKLSSPSHIFHLHPSRRAGILALSDRLNRGAFGLFNGFWNWVVLRRFLKKAGARKTFILCYFLFLVHFLLLWALREVVSYLGEVMPLVWALLVFQLFISTATSTGYSQIPAILHNVSLLTNFYCYFLDLDTDAIYLMVVENASSNAFGSVNGLAQMVSSGARSFAPVFASSLFAYSLESRIMRGHLVKAVLMRAIVTCNHTGKPLEAKSRSYQLSISNPKLIQKIAAEMTLCPVFKVSTTQWAQKKMSLPNMEEPFPPVLQQHSSLVLRPQTDSCRW